MRVDDRKGIACGGCWNIDLTKVIDAYPTESTLGTILSESMSGGGGAHNVTINLAEFDPDLDLYALGIIGSDAHGDWIVDECRGFSHIHLEQLRRTHLAKTSYTDVFVVESTGRRTFFHYRGANARFSPESVDLDSLPATILHFAYPLLLDDMDAPDSEYRTVAARFLRDVQRRGIRTAVDLVSERSERFDAIVTPALRYAHYGLMNDIEAETLSGLPLRSRSQLMPERLPKIAARIFEFGVSELVVIHFPEGAYFLCKSGMELLQPSLDLPPELIVGSAGAGDAFAAGVLYGLHQQWSLETTARFAVCAGGINLRELSTTGGTGPWQEVFALQDQFPYRDL